MSTSTRRIPRRSHTSYRPANRHSSPLLSLFPLSSSLSPPSSLLLHLSLSLSLSNSLSLVLHFQFSSLFFFFPLLLLDEQDLLTLRKLSSIPVDDLTILLNPNQLLTKRSLKDAGFKLKKK